MLKPIWTRLFVVLMLVALVGVVGCAKKEQTVAPEPPKVETPPPPPPVDPDADLKKAMEEIVNLKVYFDFDKFDLKPEARTTLQRIGELMKKFQAIGVTIEGNCDERGTAEYNLALGDKRAKAAKEFLVLLGIDAGRSQTKSFGKEQPVDPGHNEAAWSKNRRDEFKPAKK